MSNQIVMLKTPGTRWEDDRYVVGIKKSNQIYLLIEQLSFHTYYRPYGNMSEETDKFREDKYKVWFPLRGKYFIKKERKQNIFPNDIIIKLTSKEQTEILTWCL